LSSISNSPFDEEDRTSLVVLGTAIIGVAGVDGVGELAARQTHLLRVTIARLLVGRRAASRRVNGHGFEQNSSCDL
jgi:hypothetical protein